MIYPHDVFVRVSHRLLDPSKHRRVLDYGSEDRNIGHLLKRGFSAEAASGSKLPFADRAFDAAVAWQTLECGDPARLQERLTELDRILKPGGVFLGTLEEVSRNDLASHFSGKTLIVGEYEHDFAKTQARCWIVSYEK